MTRGQLVRWYYAATPVFALADLALGISVRAAGIQDTFWRIVYYAFALGCWWAMTRRPAWTPAIGIGESSVNLFLLLFGVLGPIFAAPSVIASGGDVALPFGPGRLLNLLLAGTVIVLSFHRHQSDLANLTGPGSRR